MTDDVDGKDEIQDLPGLNELLQLQGLERTIVPAAVIDRVKAEATKYRIEASKITMAKGRSILERLKLPKMYEHSRPRSSTRSPASHPSSSPRSGSRPCSRSCCRSKRSTRASGRLPELHVRHVQVQDEGAGRHLDRDLAKHMPGARAALLRVQGVSNTVTASRLVQGLGGPVTDYANHTHRGLGTGEHPAS